MATRIIRLPEVVQQTGISPTTIYGAIRTRDRSCAAEAVQATRGMSREECGGVDRQSRAPARERSMRCSPHYERGHPWKREYCGSTTCVS